MTITSPATPIVSSPGQVVNTTITCTAAAAPALAATGATCGATALDSTGAVVPVTVSACTVALPANLAAGSSVTCNASYTTPGTAGGSDTAPVSVTLTGATSATNEVITTNNTVVVTRSIVDALDDAFVKPVGTVSTSNVATNDSFLAGSTFTRTGGTCAAASMTTAGVATYTSPAVVGNTCTVTYQVCSPAPNATVCDNATLTVTASPLPILTVTKTSNQTPLVVGLATQFYTITIALTNGPTTAPITIADVLPTGITTRAAITATGGTLSGCPAAGATSLAGCSIATGAVNGNIVITVPVSVAATAANPSTNTATASGGGSGTCPAAANCTGTVTTPVIDAVDDTATKPPNIIATTDVTPNDKFPVGSTFTRTGGTCVSATMTTAGVTSYNSPNAIGGTCTVIYQLCAPAPNAAVCDTATLTVTAAALPPILTVTKTASQTPLVVGVATQFYTITIGITNGPTTAPITIADVLPTGITTRAAITATGGTLSGCPAAGATSLAGCSLATGVIGPAIITVPVTVAANAVNPSTNTATVTGGGDTTCPAAANCTGTVTTPVIDAVNDTDTKQPGVPSTTTVTGNDKFPANATVTVTGGTCAAAGPASPATNTTGILSYTSPATAAATCTVIYQLCAPAPNATVCDTATLTVTAGPAPSLTVTKTASASPLVVGQTGQFYTITIAVANGPTTAAFTLADTLPTGITTSGAVTATGGTLSGCPSTGAVNLTGCSIAAGAVTGNIVLTVPVSVASSAANPSTNSATATGGGDPLCTGIAPACTGSVTTPVTRAATITIAKTDGKSVSFSGDTNNYVVSINNQGPSPADGSVFTDTVGVGLTCPPANTVTCTVTLGAAVCPAGLTIANLTGAGVILATFPANSTLQFAYTCNVN